MTTSVPGRDPARIAVLIPVYRPPARLLRHAIMSVRQQTLDDWQLVLVDDAGGDAQVSEILAWAAQDDRITVIVRDQNAGISAASNAGLEVVTAPWLALLDHDDFLEPDALAEVLAAAQAEPEAELIYTDRDAVDMENVPTEIFFKPEWSPRRLRGNMYVAHLTVLKTAAVREVGGFRTEFDGSQDHDLVLRVTERGNPVVHVPRVLYHWRQVPNSTAADPGAKPYATQRGLLAVRAHLERTGRSGEADHSPFAGVYLNRLVPEAGLTSIVIPTRGGSSEVGGQSRVMVVGAVASILAHSYAREYEIVVVHDEHADPEYLDALRELARERLRVAHFVGPFNFSAKINLGVEHSDGDVVILLNDDVEVISEHWLDHLSALALEPDIGAVGAKLLYEDGTVQHAGHFFANGQVGHIGQGAPDDPGPFAANIVDREVVGVTAACLAMRTAVFDQLGGMDEALPNNFNDVDFCMRIRAKGYQIVQANSVLLHHYESRTRVAVVRDWEAHRIIDRLGDRLNDDPYTPDYARSPGWIGHRSVREWIRVTKEVIRTEGLASFRAKASKRLRTVVPSR